MRKFALPLLLLIAASSQAQENYLLPGDTAPSFKVGGWAKGEPVTEIKKGRITVIEFWATWCGPCIEAMPHLSEQALRYQDQVDVIGISIREEGENTPGQVQKFVKEHTNEMRYRVAWDGDNHMFEKWYKPSGVLGIPAAYIVNEKGIITWIGHTMEIDDPLAATAMGTINIPQNRAQYLQQVKEYEITRKWSADLTAAKKLFADGDEASADEIFADLIKRKPEQRYNIEVEKLILISQKSEGRALVQISARHNRASQDDAEILALLSEVILYKNGSKIVALDAAEKALTIVTNESFYQLESIANAFFLLEKWGKAIPVIERALKASEHISEEQNPQIEMRRQMLRDNLKVAKEKSGRYRPNLVG
ncbi:MAG: redoxin domain-containing protein [Armatimonadetes bacterium]|nr:redoxin domain-containing protein [Armatimonadota bacterium]